MAARFGATINAVNRGLENMKPNKGVDLIEDWETALSESEAPGTKGLLRDLGALKKQLERPEPDGERISALLHRLGEATVKLSAKAEKQGDKIRELGEALQESGDPQQDEEEDQEAKAAPKRRPAAKKNENKDGGKQDAGQKDENKK